MTVLDVRSVGGICGTSKLTRIISSELALQPWASFLAMKRLSVLVWFELNRAIPSGLAEYSIF